MLFKLYGMCLFSDFKNTIIYETLKHIMEVAFFCLVVTLLDNDLQKEVFTFYVTLFKYWMYLSFKNLECVCHFNYIICLFLKVYVNMFF